MAALSFPSSEQGGWPRGLLRAGFVWISCWGGGVIGVAFTLEPLLAGPTLPVICFISIL
jgi:hypothetical protein